MTGECFRCGAPTVERFGNGWLCEGCIPDPDGGGAEDGKASPRFDADGRIPEQLASSDAGYVPIDPRSKRHVGSRDAEDCYAAGDDVLEAGHNYGVVCRGDLGVLDEDEPGVLAPLVDDPRFPDTVWQVSGSRTSKHRFLRVPGLDEDIPLQHPETGENVGHVKAAARSYVVGPGSTHPSGGTYGPLRGDEIATVPEDELREFLDDHGFLQDDDEEPDLIVS